MFVSCNTSFLSILEHTLDFITHGFSACIAEMDTHFVGGLADFLYQCGSVLRCSNRSGIYGLHGTCFFAHGAPYSRRSRAARPNSIVLTVHKVFRHLFSGPGVFLPEVLPAKKIGAHRCRISFSLSLVDEYRTNIHRLSVVRKEPSYACTLKASNTHSFRTVLKATRQCIFRYLNILAVSIPLGCSI